MKANATLKNDFVLQRLDKANEVINQFIKSCSHSMRGPMKSIKGLVGLVRGLHPDDTNAEMLTGLIDKTVNNMEKMLDELEHFMINSDKILETREVNVAPLINRLVNNFKKEKQAPPITWTVMVGQPVRFRTDPGRLQLALSHLLSNAITFQRQQNSNKRITIRAVINEEECKIQIEDNGIGLPEKERENIFRLFYRASQQSSGAGVGLFVVHEVLEKIGGQVLVTAATGGGSLFELTIPNRYKKSDSTVKAN